MKRLAKAVRSVGVWGSLFGTLLCCNQAAEAPTASVTDSAGVTIVENPLGSVESVESWRLVADPSSEIETREEGDILLFQVNSVVPLNHGGLAVGNAGSREVLVFSPGGDLIQKLGRPGEGPGEFRSIGAIIPFKGDSLGVFDPQLRRLSVFDSSGALAREVRTNEVIDGATFTTLLPLESGDLVLFSTRGFPDSAEQGIFRVPSESFRISRTGEVLSSYGEFPGNEVFINSVGAGLVLFGKRTQYATVGDQLVVGIGENPEVSFFGPKGGLTRIVRWPDKDRAVTQDALDHFFEVGLASMPEEQQAAGRAMAEGIPHADQAPPFEGILVSDEDDIWIGGFMGPEMVIPGTRAPKRPWLVFDSSGVLRAKTETPEGFLPYSVREGRLFGVFSDEMGAETIRVYSIMRGGDH